MPTYSTTVRSPRAPEAVFDYLARFEHAQEWDPGVAQGLALTPGAPERGSRTRLMVRFLGRTAPLEYVVTEIDAPRRVVFEAENTAIRSRDTIEVAPDGTGGSTVTYAARLTPLGALAVAGPLWSWAFRRIGDRAAAGLRATLA